MKKKTLAVLVSVVLVLTMGLAVFAEEMTIGVLSGAPEDTEEVVAPAEEAVEEPTEEPAEEPTEEPVEEPAEEPAEEPVEEPVKEPVKIPEGLPFKFTTADLTKEQFDSIYQDQWFDGVADHLDVSYVAEEGKLAELRNIGEQTCTVEFYVCYLAYDNTIAEDSLQTFVLEPGESATVEYVEGYDYAYAGLVSVECGGKRVDFPAMVGGIETPHDPEAAVDAVPVDPSVFTTSATLHKYGENTLAIVDVKNDGEQNSLVTVTGNYLAADGSVLDTETQTFDGFSAGWSNSFVFNPGYAFDGFTHEVTAVETDYDSMANNVLLEQGSCDADAYGLDLDAETWEEIFENATISGFRSIGAGFGSDCTVAYLSGFEGNGETYGVRVDADLLLVAPNGDVEKVIDNALVNANGYLEDCDGRHLTLVDSYELFGEYRDLSDYKLVVNVHSVNSRTLVNVGHSVSEVPSEPSFISWVLRCGYGLFIDAPLPR